jgi:hypothetical protein
VIANLNNAGAHSDFNRRRPVTELRCIIDKISDRPCEFTRPTEHGRWLGNDNHVTSCSSTSTFRYSLHNLIKRQLLFWFVIPGIGGKLHKFINK